ncbi:alpha/beta hydrolase family protein [Dyadobacter psychrotolerans]|uniref:Alpha/beta hydrolase n=1 Tax=Dyadobacter psychrotolerans TaxID=2541721 RepID=A0A4R5DRJ1_9BACT|nr:alpha/beta hydrolase [Dyadobacter psychrotolerans]TDE14850.1 alpha/beta hydrolase [Dyadobacter psychrotolerans]
MKTRKEINQSKVGLVGHSEGGMIAQMVASTRKDINFIVLLAAPGFRGDSLLLIQQELIERAMGVTESDIKRSKSITKHAYQLILNSQNTSTLKADLLKYGNAILADKKDSVRMSKIKPPQMSHQDFLVANTQVISSPWFKYILKYDPAKVLQKVNCAVLALNGGKDLQIPAKENLSAIAAALKKGGNDHVTTLELPGLNHLFQECKTGSPSEYATIEQTFSPKALSVISDWIYKQTK